MTRTCSLWFGPLLLLVLGPAWAQPPHPTSSPIICPRVVTGPVLDGRLDDWSPLPQVVMASAEDWHPAAPQFAVYGGPQDISAEIRLVWDNRALYLAIDVRDDVLVRVHSPSEVDRGDSIVLALTGEGPEPANQFVVALLRGASLVWRAQPAARAGELRNVGRGIWARPEDHGWRVSYELALPWSELAPLRPIPGQPLNLSVSACDDDGAGIKGCLERTVAVVLAPDTAGLVVAAARPASLRPSFPKPEMARFDRRAFAFANQPVVVFGGGIDYARLPKAVWADRLSLLKAAGMNTVAVTVPWAHHQPTPDQLDLSDLKAFLDLCQEAGLWVQLDLGPYAGDDWEAGGVPGWALGRASGENLQGAVADWYRALLPMVKRYQLTNRGPIADVLIRPLPDRSGRVDAGALQALLELVRGAGIQVPVLTANAPAARGNSRQSLANVLDTLAFYGAASLPDVLASLRALVSEENGPAVLSSLPGSCDSPQAARRSASTAKAALGLGATAILLSDFAPGLEATGPYLPGQPAAGIIDLAGARTPGYPEVRLIGSFVRLFGPELTGAVAAEGIAKADDPGVQIAARLGEKAGFLFLWDEKSAAHQVRLTYTPPGTAAAVSIPEAGSITLPAGSAKILPLGVPVGRGLLHYSTSEIAGLQQVGERTLLVLYGDVDTPGEVALGWPGPPLVSGEVKRQRWDPEKSTLILDYFHSRQDQYLLVDDLEIAILSHQRAAWVGDIAGPSGGLALSAGAAIVGGSITPSLAEVALDCQAGSLQVSAALPAPPSAVTLDGAPLEFSFATPSRVLTCFIATEPFAEERRATGLQRLGHALLGGPPKLAARFDRAGFLPDDAAPAGVCHSVPSLGLAPEALDLRAGSFARLRASFESGASTRLRISGSTDPALVLINGKPALELSGSAPEREADVAALLTAGPNQIEIILDIMPRKDGFAGLWEAKRVPEVSLVGAQGSVPIGNWEVCSGPAGEAAGWAKLDLDASQWHLLRLGAWRAQGRELAEMWGVGWYRVAFGLPRAGTWRIPYYLDLGLHGSALLYLNGTRFADCQGDGAYRLPLPAPPLEQGGDNLLAAAVFGLAPEAGLDQAEVTADQQQMTRRRTLSIKF